MEVAHDMQLQVSKFVTGDLKLINSFDTWHGICNIVISFGNDYCCSNAFHRDEECIKRDAEDH